MKSILKLLLLFSFTANAQLGKEAWHWQFSCGRSLDFSTGIPIEGTSSICPSEGCASISSPNTGQLLFYTDGTTVFNSHNDIMPNGTGLIGGQGSSTQAALIIPKPCTTNIYYLISSDEEGNFNSSNQGVHYSIVDMNLHGGLGDVTIKNVLLTPPSTTEDLVGVRHNNGNDYWIITHPFNSNSFNAYLVTKNGINLTPVVSNCGTIIQSNSVIAQTGYLKASPNGKKMASVFMVNNLSTLEIYDFDNATGIISNPITINYTWAANSPYGLSFSPNSKKLYCDFFNEAILFQYDLSSGVASQIIASEKNLSPNNCSLSPGISAIQIAPDGKMYIINGMLYGPLLVINSPDSLGAACNLRQSTYYGGGAGLPNFIDGGINEYNYTLDTSICANKNIVINSNNVSNNIWSNGAVTQSISVSDAGKYWVSYTNKYTCAETDTFVIKINPYPKVDLGNDIAFCSGDIKLNVPNGFSSYLWSTGQIYNSINVTKTGIYWVDVNLNGCVSRDTINVFADTNKLNVVYPNIISPNGDNVNDYIFFGNDLFTSLHLEIFDRWGKKIFTSDDTQCIWFPDENIKAIDEGTCYYIAQYNIACDGVNELKTLKGFITVVK